jgi:rod shape determining protein RodA
MYLRPLFREGLHLDTQLLAALILLCLLGLMIVFSATGQQIDAVYRQGVRMLLAFAVLLVLAQIPPALFARWSIAVYIAGLALLVMVLFVGEITKGAQRWLSLGPISFQPSELMKIAVPMLLARYLAGSDLPPAWWKVLASGGIILLPVLLIAKQPDLDTAMLVAAGGIGLLFLAGLRWRYLLGLLVLAGLSAPVLWYSMHDYQRQRIITFLDPESDPLGAGYHIIQSTIAIGSGGLYGKGWLNGTQSHLQFLPERSTDFIFAVFAEEFGLIGVLVLLSLYLFVIGRCLYIAANAQDTFGKLLSGGIVLTFFVYVFVNIGTVSGVLPVAGMPLPLISMGGTSLVTLLAGFGMLMAVHTHRRLLSD